MVELKPCPFCGGQPRLMEESGDERVGYANTVKIQCSGCGVSNSASGDTSKGGYADNSTTKQRAVDKWNRRTPSPASTAGGERQSIRKDLDFRGLLRRLIESDGNLDEKREALIAHIDTWAARSADDEAREALGMCIKALESAGISKSTREFALENARRVLDAAPGNIEKPGQS